MEKETVLQKHEGNVPVTVVPAQALIDRLDEVRGVIARRAYELFECRGRLHGRDVDDWLQAESQILHPCRHDLKDSGEAIIFRVEMRGGIVADQLKIGLEPRRLIVISAREVEVSHGDSEGTYMRKEAQQILEVCDLPVDVDPSRTNATLKDQTLEVVMPKVAKPARPSDKAKATSPGK